MLPLGYIIGKVTPIGVQFYEEYDVKLETFIEGNYLVCRADLSGEFPQSKHWLK